MAAFTGATIAKDAELHNGSNFGPVDGAATAGIV
jgi:hypothetical protein